MRFVYNNEANYLNHRRVHTLRQNLIFPKRVLHVHDYKLGEKREKPGKKTARKNQNKQLEKLKKHI